MKKLVTLVFCALFAVSLLIFSTLSTANAQEPNIKIITDYNHFGFINIRVYNSSDFEIANIDSDELEILRYYEDADKIVIWLDANFYLTTPHLDFIGITKTIGGVTTPVTETGDVYVIDNIASAPIEIKIAFDVASFEITSLYKDFSGSDISGTLDKDFIEFFTVKNGVATKLEKVADQYFINYGQRLRIKTADSITFNSKQSSYNLDSLYFNIRHERMLVTNSEYTIDDYFLYEYYDFFQKIQFIAYYTQNYKYSVNFSNSDLVEDCQVKNKNTGAVVSANDFFEPGTELQITVTLVSYAKLSKLSAGAPNIDGFQLGDTFTEDGNKIIINFITSNVETKNLLIHLEYVTFNVNSEGSTGAQIIFERNTFKFDDETLRYVEISISGIGGMEELKGWKIEGIEVPKVGEKDEANGIERIDEFSVKIDTKIWYGIYQNNFRSEVLTGTKSSIIIIIIAAAAVAVLAVLVLLLLMFKHSSTKRKIRAIMEAERTDSYHKDQSALFADLRGDKAYKISDEEVKARMKEEKHHKKD